MGLIVRSLAFPSLTGPACVACRVSPRRARYFLLLRQKKVPKEKASRVRRPCAAHRARCVARSRREIRKLALRAQTCVSLFPPAPALLASAHGGGEPNTKSQYTTRTRHGASLWSSAVGFFLPCGCAEKRSGRRIKRRACLSAASLRGSRLARASQVASAQPGSQTPGSPFFAYFLWRRKESRSPAGASPGKATPTRTSIKATHSDCRAESSASEKPAARRASRLNGFFNLGA